MADILCSDGLSNFCRYCQGLTVQPHTSRGSGLDPAKNSNSVGCGKRFQQRFRQVRGLEIDCATRTDNACMLLETRVFIMQARSHVLKRIAAWAT